MKHTNHTNHTSMVKRAVRLLAACVVAGGLASALGVVGTPSAEAMVFVGSGTGSNTVICNSSTHVMTVNTNLTPAMDYYANSLPTWIAIHVYSAQTRTWIVNTQWLPGSYSRSASVQLSPGTYYVYFDYAFQTQSGIVYSHEWAGIGGAYPGTYANQSGYSSLPSCTV